MDRERIEAIRHRTKRRDEMRLAQDDAGFLLEYVDELEAALKREREVYHNQRDTMAEYESRIKELEAQIELCGMPAVESADHIVDLRSRIEAVRKLKLYAPTNDGYGGWKMVYADGNESQTFVDADKLREALNPK